MRTEAPVVVEGPPDGDVDAIVAAVHEALGAGGMIRVPNLASHKGHALQPTKTNVVFLLA